MRVQKNLETGELEIIAGYGDPNHEPGEVIGVVENELAADISRRAMNLPAWADKWFAKRESR